MTGRGTDARSAPSVDELRRLVEGESREMALLVDRSGTVLQLDERARRHLGLAPGDRLERIVAPGGEAKAEQLLAAVHRGPTRGWEVPILSCGRLATLLVAGRPHDGALALLASRALEDQGEALASMNDSLTEVVGLNRRISRQKRELERLGRELAESNRGVLALHDELDERTEAIGRSIEIQSRVVANVSHEFKTPLHSILGLSKLLLDRTDGPLDPEQEKQVRYIRTAAQELSQLVDDMLDLSKLDSGTVGLRSEELVLSDFLGTLRGMLRPLVPEGQPVELEFDPLPDDLPERLETDKGKLSQVLRNLVSNALKFTPEGSVRVTTRHVPGTGASGGWIAFSVADTGIGIAPEDQERIFEEFEQVQGAAPPTAPAGTGLGLPLSRRLAALLGGEITVESEPGAGSTFTLRLPAVHPEVEEMSALEARGRERDPSRAPILIVEDDRKTLFIYERYLSQAGFQVLAARTIDDARELLQAVRPQAIVLDIILERETTWAFLEWLKSSSETRQIPVHVVTVTDREQRARALGADEFWLKPIDQEQLVAKLRSMGERADAKVLVIDDEPAARYLIRRYLEGLPYEVLEAADGVEGVRLAVDEMPQVILLDFMLGREDAFDVLDDLKADPRTRSIPVIINTSLDLPPRERSRLAGLTEGIVQKQSLSRELAIHRIRDALDRARARG